MLPCPSIIRRVILGYFDLNCCATPEQPAQTDFSLKIVISPFMLVLSPNLSVILESNLYLASVLRGYEFVGLPSLFRFQKCLGMPFQDLGQHYLG